jgi:hypothetical protein
VNEKQNQQRFFLAVQRQRTALRISAKHLLDVLQPFCHICNFERFQDL